MADANRMLAPGAGKSIRQPTDAGQKKGNVVNPPRFTNLAMGGLNSAGARGVEAGEWGVKPPGETLTPVNNVKGSKD